MCRKVYFVLLSVAYLKFVQLVDVVPYLPTTQPIQSGFQETLDYLKNTTKLDEDPCGNFYDYACGSYGKYFKDNSPFAKITRTNLELVRSKLNQLDHGEPKPVRLTKIFFQKCMQAGGYLLNRDIQSLLSRFKAFESVTGIPFPALMKSNDQVTVNSSQFAKAIGYLEGPGKFWGQPEGNPTQQTLLLTAGILHLAQKGSDAYILGLAVNPFYCSVDSPGVNGINVFLDAYQKKVGNISAEVVKSTLDDLVAIAETIKKGVCDYGEIKTPQQQVALMLRFKPFTASQLSCLFRRFDANAFLQEFTRTASQEVKNKAISQNFTLYSIIDQLQKLDSVFGPTSKITDKQLANHFYAQIISTWSIPASKTKDEIQTGNDYSTDVILFEKSPFLMPRSSPKYTGQLLRNETESLVETSCLLQVQYYYFPMAYDRIYIDARTETENLENMRTKITQMVKYILRGFRSMVDQVNWLTPVSHEKALKKLDNMAINLLYNNISMDDKKLDEDYKAVDFDINTPIDTMMDSLRKFRYDNQLAQLVMNTVDRHDFGYRIDSTGAWYAPFMNSINIPLGFLQQPVFDANWPMEYNFGVLGLVLGHEITHGFDVFGVELDELGDYAPWMDPLTKEAFAMMSKCLTKQYSQYAICGNSTDRVNGTKTLGENMADNAGIHAAFRGFQHWKDTVGKDPGLPPTEGPLGNLKDDQLFFFAQSQLWCEKECTYDRRNDEHSPARYRVQGHLSNFPAFHNAFDCKIGDKYRSKEKCDVWITEAMHNRFMSKDFLN